MASNTFLDLCLANDRALDSTLSQLQGASERHALSGQLELHARGQHLVCSITELADALSGTIKRAEEKLVQAAQSVARPDGAASDTSRPEQDTEGRAEGRSMPSRPGLFVSTQFGTPGQSSGRFDDASPEPGKLDLGSFPSLGSTMSQKVGASYGSMAFRTYHYHSLPGDRTMPPTLCHQIGRAHV